MRPRRAVAAVALLLASGSASWSGTAALAGSLVHHDLSVELDPARRRIEVTATLTLPEARAASGQAVFLLHENLSVAAVSPGAALRRIAESPGSVDFPAGSAAYRVHLPPGERAFTVRYSGVLHDPLSAEQEYSRGFRRTSGLVGEEGAFLSGASLWVPQLGRELVTFSLDVRLPRGWDAVSQGRRTAHERGEAGTRARWEESSPQEGIYLVAGPLTELSRQHGPWEVQVFLRQPDPELAGRYLEAGGRYLEMYSRLLGPYPYEKFALVENFWETGYGMPSFALLGPRVLRLPFILHSSYPHEILHNWWGNGVYVDYGSGNWGEGLTAYLADHLLQETQGGGAEYRQATLQKYVDYASRQRDFPLREFRARHSSATEAVGYGKSLLFFHMLRLQLGDEVFLRGLRGFYKANKFRAATFDDLRLALEVASGQDLRGEFDQWVERTGAPALVLSGVSAAPAPQGDEWVLALRIDQVQQGIPYRLRVPVAVTLEGRQEAHRAVLEIGARSTTFRLQVPGRPVRVDVDPELDLFRRLDPAELPPALSGGFGAEAVLVLLPSGAPPELLAAYREVARGWARSQPGRWEVVEDREVAALPADRAVWLLGWDNRFLSALEQSLRPYGATLGRGGARWDGVEVPAGTSAAVLVGRHPADPGLTLSLVATGNPAALPGLGRRLPHYHKYSYLAFEGDEPHNTAKGRWPVVDSPLSAAPSGGPLPPPGVLPHREPLARPPPAFSAEGMADTVRALSSPGLEGRDSGTPGPDAAAERIAEGFRAAGLVPGGDGGSYFQTFAAREGAPEGEPALRNVIGVLPGHRQDWAGQSVVVGARYHHPGRAPGRAEDRGHADRGAEEDAGGVAVLLGLARTLGPGRSRTWRPARTLVFAAFAGEEAGRLGSRHYAAAGGPHPASRAVAMLSLDTAGRPGSGPLRVLGGGTAREWNQLFQGAGVVTGVPVEVAARDPGGSDPVSFHEIGVPAVQVFTGPRPDVRRATGTADRVDGQGLVRVASVVQEMLEYLTGSPDPLTSTLPDASGAGSRLGEGAGRRKVYLGTVPDPAHEGPGLRLSGVSPGSPVERAGLLPGDVVLGLGGVRVETLSDYARALRALAPGDDVRVRFLREGREWEVSVRAEER
ncbi:MAG: M28 family peptidase [Deferrisomatales bacterium]|nr:M28 family peptidase [Deferrisomatales bacterium]